MSRYQRTKIWHVGNKWNAQKDNNEGIVTSGKTPEEAIEKLHEEYPVLSMCEIIYDNKRSIKKAEKVDVCPVCNKTVSYYRTKKENGRNGVVVFHDGDAIPEGATKADGVTTEYKKWLLEKFHQDILQ